MYSTLSLFISARSGMAHINDRMHSFTCHPHVNSQLEWTIPAFISKLQTIATIWPVHHFHSCCGYFTAYVFLVLFFFFGCMTLLCACCSVMWLLLAFGSLVSMHNIVCDWLHICRLLTVLFSSSECDEYWPAGEGSISHHGLNTGWYSSTKRARGLYAADQRTVSDLQQVPKVHRWLPGLSINGHTWIGC